jgi:cysteine desulfuration protein SufE
MTIEDRQQQLIAEFSTLTDWEVRYARIIRMGRELPPLSEDLKIEDLKVSGCQSQVWLKADRLANGLIEFRADSDALIVKGLIAILLKVFSNARPSEILNAKTEFLQDMGLTWYLSPSRANGLMSMVKQIKYYAAAFQALEQRPS